MSHLSDMARSISVARARGMRHCIHMNTTQLTMFGGRSEVEKVRPYAEGDRITTKHFGAVVVTWVSDNIHGQVMGGVRLDTGAECVVLAREVLYRSVG